MNKRAKRNIALFQRVQKRNGKYSLSPFTPHEQAIREHIRRGFEEGLARVAGLLDQRNKL